MKLALLLLCSTLACAQVVTVTSKPQHYQAVQFHSAYVYIKTTTICVGGADARQLPDGSCYMSTPNYWQVIVPTVQNKLPKEFIDKNMVIFQGPEHLGAWDDTRHGYVGIHEGDWIVYLERNWVQILNNHDFHELYQ